MIKTLVRGLGAIPVAVLMFVAVYYSIFSYTQKVTEEQIQLGVNAIPDVIPMEGSKYNI